MELRSRGIQQQNPEKQTTKPFQSGASAKTHPKMTSKKDEHMKSNAPHPKDIGATATLADTKRERVEPMATTIGEGALTGKGSAKSNLDIKSNEPAHKKQGLSKKLHGDISQ